MRFPHAVGDARVAKADVPENPVALPKTLVREMLARAGLSLVEVHYGSWCHQAQSLTHSDMIIATKP